MIQKKWGSVNNWWIQVKEMRVLIILLFQLFCRCHISQNQTLAEGVRTKIHHICLTAIFLLSLPPPAHDNNCLIFQKSNDIEIWPEYQIRNFVWFTALSSRHRGSTHRNLILRVVKQDLSPWTWVKVSLSHSPSILRQVGLEDIRRRYRHRSLGVAESSKSGYGVKSPEPRARSWFLWDQWMPLDHSESGRPHLHTWDPTPAHLTVYPQWQRWGHGRAGQSNSLDTLTNTRPLSATIKGLPKWQRRRSRNTLY